uniref:Uncharacterized protein n=1 Tax=Rhizophora mucronata TaxID=61149 RepID=A0A2P2J3M1_RHIMU
MSALKEENQKPKMPTSKQNPFPCRIHNMTMATRALKSKWYYQLLPQRIPGSQFKIKGNNGLWTG